MKEIIMRGISALKNVLTYRCSAGVPPAGLKAVLGEVDEFEALLVNECSKVEERLSRVLDENGLLRGLVGVKESDILPRLIKQGEEVHGLRNQIMALHAAGENLLRDNEALRARTAAAEHERSTIHNLREEDSKRFKKELDALAAQLKEFQAAVRKEIAPKPKENVYEI
jgi:hypothetical protein